MVTKINGLFDAFYKDFEFGGGWGIMGVGTTYEYLY
jgi:hypothetical protein